MLALKAVLAVTLIVADGVIVPPNALLVTTRLGSVDKVERNEAEAECDGRTSLAHAEVVESLLDVAVIVTRPALTVNAVLSLPMLLLVRGSDTEGIDESEQPFCGDGLLIVVSDSVAVSLGVHVPAFTRDAVALDENKPDMVEIPLADAAPLALTLCNVVRVTAIELVDMMESDASLESLDDALAQSLCNAVDDAALLRLAREVRLEVPEPEETFVALGDSESPEETEAKGDIVDNATVLENTMDSVALQELVDDGKTLRLPLPLGERLFVSINDGVAVFHRDAVKVIVALVQDVVDGEKDADVDAVPRRAVVDADADSSVLTDAIKLTDGSLVTVVDPDPGRTEAVASTDALEFEE